MWLDQNKKYESFHKILFVSSETICKMVPDIHMTPTANEIIHPIVLHQNGNHGNHTRTIVRFILPILLPWSGYKHEKCHFLYEKHIYICIIVTRRNVHIFTT